jgi:hypothetical protein
MSLLHIRQIKAYLKSTFDGLIDLTDVTNQNELETNFNTRANAAFSIMHNANTSAEIAAKSVTDGFGDNGIDAIYFDTNNYILYLVQSKWVADGNGGIDREGIQKFLKGVKDILNARLDRFNTKVQDKSVLINRALDDARIKVSLILTYTGIQPIHDDLMQDITDFLDEMNDPTELVIFKSEKQRDIYNTISQGAQGAPIDIDVSITECGQIREPYQAFYGQVASLDIVNWYETHQSKLFDPNIRVFLGDTTVNENIINSVKTEAQNIFYYNNGITALCSSKRKKPIGGNTRESGIFEVKGLKIVNGAQTVGSLSKSKIENEEQLADAKVLIRFISLDQCPDGFEKDVTKYNNTQKKIDKRDFVSLDPEQERIKTKLSLEAIDYVYKSSERVINQTTGFDLEDATIALACNNSVDYAIQVKREIGKLWEDITKAPYKSLFTNGLQGSKLWKLVKIQRVIDEVLDLESRQLSGRERLICVHGKRIVAFKTLNSLSNDIKTSPDEITQDELTKLKDKTKEFLTSVMIHYCPNNFSCYRHMSIQKAWPVLYCKCLRIG